MKSVRERQISFDITYTGNLKYDVNERIYKTETDSQTQETNICLLKGIGPGRNELGILDSHTHTAVCKTDNPQGPTVLHRELYSVSYNALYWKRI